MSPSEAKISTILHWTIAAVVVSVASGQVTCGTGGFRLAGGNALYPYAATLGQSYSSSCNKNYVTNPGSSFVYNSARDVVIEAGGALVGINRVCDKVGGAVEIGAISREYRTTEATSADGWNWKCVNNPSRTMTRVDTAIDGISVIVKKSGTAATCIGYLKGGFTTDQLRWIYSNLSIEQLVQTGWSRTALSQGKGGTTPLWSNLHRSCGDKEINLAGRDLVGSGTTDYFRDKIFKAPNENIDQSGTLGYKNSVSDLEVIGWVAVDDAMIAFTTLAYYTQKADLLTLAAVQNRLGDYVKPSKDTIRSNEYNPLTRRLTFEVLQSSLASTKAFIEFTFSPAGDTLISNSGYDTVPAADQILMLSRIGSTRGVDLSTITCDTNGLIRVGGNTAVRQHINIWSLHYTAKCPKVDVSIFNVATNPNVVSLQRACGVATAGVALEVATTNAKTAYATVGNAFTYKCPTTAKKLIELTVAPGLFAYVNDASAVYPISRGLFRFALSTTGSTLLTRIGLTPNTAAVNTNMLTRIPKSGGICFPGDSTVEVLSRGDVAMKDLSIGDMVKVAGGKFSEIYSFGHYEPDTEAPFLSIDAGLEKPLLISSTHMVFVEDKAVAASAVVVGDKLSLVGGFATVKKITEVRAAGLFAPFTKDGTIVVDSIVASSYVDLKDNSPFVIGGIITLDMHSIAHMAQAPHRLVCALSPSFCASETYINGVSVWVDAPLVASVWLFKQHPAILTAAFLPVYAFILLAAATEALFTNPVLLVIAVVATLLTTRKNKKSA